MSEDQKKQLEQQLWNIANTLRGKMNAGKFRDIYSTLLQDLNPTRYISSKNEVIAQVLSHLDKLNFRSHETNANVSGGAFVNVIGKCASPG